MSVLGQLLCIPSSLLHNLYAVTGEGEKGSNIEQWLSTGVLWNPRVPGEVPSGSAAKHWNRCIFGQSGFQYCSQRTLTVSTFRVN